MDLINADPPAPLEKIALLFSGGLDSTLEAVERFKQYKSVLLVTFNNGYCINIGAARRRVAELGRHYGSQRITHKIVNTAPLMKELLKEHDRLWEKYRSPLIVDLACKMAGVTELIFAAKENDIVDISDGSSHEQNEIFIQQPEFSDHIKIDVTEYGLRFLRPAMFDLGRIEKKEQLDIHGLKSGTQALERIHVTGTLFQQPFCLRGIITFFFTSPIRHLSVSKKYALPTDRAMEAWDELWPIAKIYLNKKLAESGIENASAEKS